MGVVGHSGNMIEQKHQRGLGLVSALWLGHRWWCRICECTAPKILVVV